MQKTILIAQIQIRPQKISTKNAYITTYANSRQNSVNYRFALVLVALVLIVLVLISLVLIALVLIALILIVLCACIAQKLAPAEEKNSTDIFARSAFFCISDEMC